MHLLPQTQLQNGKYRIIEKIGQGGFGIIYKAYHRDLDCEVCIKEFFYRDLCERKSDSTHITVVSTSAEKIEMVKSLNKKFFKEAQRLGQFRSANIIQVMDCFEENSTAYFVMEYIDGGSLEQYLESNGKLSEPKVKEIIVPIIKALGLVHDKGLLHLDIKPANIMIRKDESPVLIDFGISKYFDVDGGHTTTAPIGISKGFAPIEQYGGNVADFSKATDIYSLCATLYRMVTGTNPPEPLMVMQKGIESPQKLNTGLSTAFSDLIVKGLSVNKGDRPQEVEELLELMGEISKPIISKPKLEETKPSIEKKDETTELLEKPKEESKIDFSYIQQNHTNVKEVKDEKKSINIGWVLAGVVAVVILISVVISNSNGGSENYVVTQSEPTNQISAQPMVEKSTTFNLSDIKYSRYINSRYNYCIDYPEGILFEQRESDNSDGTFFKTKEGSEKLRVYGMYESSFNGNEYPIENLYNDELLNYSNDTRSIAYKKLGQSFFVISGYDSGSIFYLKVIKCKDIEGNNAYAYAILKYNESEKDLYNYISTHLFKTFKRT